MDDKGSSQIMDMDLVYMDNKRPQDCSAMVGGYADSAMKRPKLSSSHDIAPVFLVKVTVDQPRQAL